MRAFLQKLDRARELLVAAQTQLFVTIVFFAVITPIGWLKRLLGKSELELGFDPDRESYARPVRPRDSEHFRYQF